MRDEGEGHQSPDVAVGPLVADVCTSKKKVVLVSDLFFYYINPPLCPFSTLLTGLS